MSMTNFPKCASPFKVSIIQTTLSFLLLPEPDPPNLALLSFPFPEIISLFLLPSSVFSSSSSSVTVREDECVVAPKQLRFTHCVTELSLYPIVIG